MLEFRRAAAALCLLTSPLALAVGERIAVSASDDGLFLSQLRESLCVSMECVAAGKGTKPGPEYFIHSRFQRTPSGGDVEVKLQNLSGSTLHTQKLQASSDGKLAATDVVLTVAALQKAIEAPAMKEALTREAARKAEESGVAPAASRAAPPAKKAPAGKVPGVSRPGAGGKGAAKAPPRKAQPVRGRHPR